MKKLRVLSILLSAVMLITGLGLTGLTALAAETKLNKTTRTLTPGETYTLKLNNATSSVTWSSSDKKVATVSSSGKVKAVKNGTVTITAKSNGKRYKCEVRVQRNRIQRDSSTIKVNETLQCKLKGKNTEKIKWSSEDKSIATVNSKGVVTAKKTGKVKIIATFGKRSKSFTLTVKAATTSSKSTLKLVKMPSNVLRNENVTIEVSGKPNTEYSIAVYYSSGKSTAKGLEPKKSNSDGYISWTWKIGVNTKPGERYLIISGGGEAMEVTFTVN